MLLLRRSLLSLAAALPLLAACGGGPKGEQPSGAAGTTDTTTTTEGLPSTSQSPPQRQVYVRPNFGKLDPNGPEVAALRKGVQAMMGRPATDPTSWLYQANMHGTYDTPALQAWNTCQHGNYLFLSWHRMYLYYFERILRAASGDPNLALPFWDYTDPAQRAIPLPLREPAGAQNPLYVEQRAPGINDGAEVPESGTTFDQAMAFTNFTSPPGSGLSFGGQLVSGPTHFAGGFGQLESQPHNIIHVLVGGEDGWMSDPNMAARDPVFWLHHANIDRLWSHWISLGDGRTDPSDTLWTTQLFTFFDEKGQAVQMTGQQVVDAAAQLNYKYAEGTGDQPTTEALPESLPSAPFTNPKGEVIVDKPVTARLRDQRASVALTIPAAEPESVGNEGHRLTLSIEGIQFGRPGVYYEVYANLPAGAAPDRKSPNYVGNLAVFGQLADGTPAHAHGDVGKPGEKSLATGATLSYDVQRLIDRLRGQPGYKGDLKLDFVPKGLVPPKNRPQKESLAPVREVRFSRVKLVRQ
ncbi:MAG TPA: tyrosinase family protein [Thermoanaerobaculia bacterium]